MRTGSRSGREFCPPPISSSSSHLNHSKFVSINQDLFFKRRHIRSLPLIWFAEVLAKASSFWGIEGFPYGSDARAPFPWVGPFPISFLSPPVLSFWYTPLSAKWVDGMWLFCTIDYRRRNTHPASHRWSDSRMISISFFFFCYHDGFFALLYRNFSS